LNAGTLATDDVRANGEWDWYTDGLLSHISFIVRCLETGSDTDLGTELGHNILQCLSDGFCGTCSFENDYTTGA